VTDATDSRVRSVLKRFWDGIPLLAACARLGVALWIIIPPPSITDLGIAMLLLWSVSDEANNRG
jgi:hypothetical protein